MLSRTGKLMNTNLLKQISFLLQANNQPFLKLNEERHHYITIHPHKLYCSQVTPKIPSVGYAEIKDLPRHPEKLLIDVRSAEEIQETGLIPTSINIPLDEVTTDLGCDVDAKRFQTKYGHQKPNFNSEVIFSCKSGKRALKAAKSTATLGYTNVKYYAGSWQDWAKHEGLPQ